jgi:hypothetical protein
VVEEGDRDALDGREAGSRLGVRREMAGSVKEK